MKLEVEFSAGFCDTDKFIINGVPADIEDFGVKKDCGLDDRPDYGCGDMTFLGIPATDVVLDKYKITLAEYAILIGQLEAGLSFGYCTLCE